MRTFLLFMMLCAVSFAAQNARASIRAIGQFESSNTVIYSIYVASKEEDLADLQLSASMPANTRFLENVDAPAGVRYDGVADNIITWTVPALNRDTLLGPLTFRIRIDSSRVEQTPVAPPFWLSYQKPTSELLEDPGTPEQLKPLADIGVVTIDARGTLDSTGKNMLITVGDSGVLLYVPENAVSGQVTFTFRRLPVDDANMPANAAGTWWCALYEVQTNPPNVNFAKQIVYSLPSRRPTPVGLAVKGFSKTGDGEWKEATGPQGGKLPAFGFGGFGNFGGGGCITAPFGPPACGCIGFNCGFGGFQGFGVSDADRRVGAMTGSTLTQNFGVPLRPAQITDGTSNTIIAILIGIR